MNTEKIDKYFKFLDVPSTPLIGVDLSVSSIKCVELSQSRNGSVKIENYAIESTPKDAFNEQGIGNADSLGAALKRAWVKLDTKIKNIAIAIPSNIAITKRVKFSKDLDEIAIADEVLVEAGHFIPFSLDDVNIDWVVLGPHPSSPTTDNEILICATRRDRILDYMAAAEAAGLKVIKVDIDNFAQQLAFDHMIKANEGYMNEVIAVADAGSSMLNIAIYNKGEEMVFSKEIAFGSNQLSDSIRQIYGISTEQAEDAKRKGGAGLTDYQNQALEPFLASMSMEINRTIQFFLTQATVEKIDRIMLAGGCAAFDGAAEMVGSVTQIKTEAFNPFVHMDESGRLKNRNLAKEAPMLLTACGLALRRFDI
jgi:type IV pilus assembly protein PilM